VLAQWLGGGGQGQDVEPREYDLFFGTEYRSSDVGAPMISPDGRWVAVALWDSVMRPVTALRSLIDGQTRRLEYDAARQHFFWSPDSRYLGYAANGRLHKLHVETMSSQAIGESSQLFSRGGSWSVEDQIIFAPNANSGLTLIRADGTGPIEATTLDTALVDGSHRWPKFLPDGRRFLFTLWSNLAEERANVGGIYLGSLDGAAPRRLLRDASESVFSPSGHILFHRDGKLMAVDFDVDAGETTGEARVVANQVTYSATSGQLGASVSDASELVYSNLQFDSEAQFQSVALDGSDEVDVGAPLKTVFGFAISSRGDKIGVEVLGDVGSAQVWIGDIRRGTFSRLSRIENDCGGVEFSPDGREVAYVVTMGDRTELYRHDVNGARPARRVLTNDGRLSLEQVEHWYDDRHMLVSGFPEAEGERVIYRVDVEAGELETLLSDAYTHAHPRISPDGRWIAYMSMESGRPEIYVRNWPDLQAKWQVSRDGGYFPNWSPDGSELVFESASALELRSVSFTIAGEEPTIGLPARKFALAPDMEWPVLSPDHDRLYYADVQEPGVLPPAKIAIGWE
jgi:Tol biopolymer transport system component